MHDSDFAIDYGIYKDKGHIQEIGGQIDGLISRINLAQEKVQKAIKEITIF